MMKKIAVRAVVLILALAIVAPAAQAGSRGRDSAFQIRLGGFFPDADGEFWAENESVFTLDGSDFDGATVGFSYVSSVNNNFEIGINADFYEEETYAFYRGEVTPIGHETRLETVPVTVDLRFIPAGRYRGRSGARQPVFYLGAGAGLNFWEYEEIGDFIDFTVDPNEIFFDRFVEDGEALQVHALAGLEIPMSRGFNVLLEVRHSWVEDNLSGAFAGLGDIDLGGGSAFIGGSFRW